MAASSYDLALARLLKHEGGYSNHPSDPGGPTRFGITIHDYRRYIDGNGTADDVRNMKLSQAAAIYRAHYWDALRCDDLPAGLDYALFDYGVNSGTGRAAKVMARLTGQTAGNIMTDPVLTAIRKTDSQALIVRLCDERLAFLKSLKTWPVFGAGWSRRVAEVRRDALAMAKGTNGKARAGGAAASVVAGAAGAQAAHVAGAPLWLTLVIAVTGMALAGWLGWKYGRKRRQEIPAAVADGASS